MAEPAAAREPAATAPTRARLRDAGDPAPAPPPRPRLTIRRRRLRRAAIVVGLVAGAGLALAWWLAARAKPATRVPGEALAEITDRLAKPLPAGAPEPAFADVTAAAGLGDFVSFAGERSSQLPEDMGAGAAWGDYDGDGDVDLFVVAAGGPLTLAAAQRAPSRLYENLGGGRFRAAAGFPETRILGMSAAWGDVEGDGDLDLAVSGYDTLLLFRNQGGGRFVRDERFASPPGFWSGSAWGDFDRDGDLDLYVCGYVQYTPADAGAPSLAATQQYGTQVPYTLNPASFEPERNLLLENDGEGSFTEVAALWGVANPEGRSLGALWHDFDDDGRLDLYVANDISDNALFLNRGDTFEDGAHAAWVADHRGAMGLAAGDFDRDGDDDLFITHWLAQENALYQSRLRASPPPPDAPLLAPPDAGARPPRLTFTDVGVQVGVGAIALPVVGWGTELADFDADGWLDIAVLNGSTVESRSDRRRLEPQPPFLLWNQGGRSFHDLAPRLPALAEPRVGRGLATADYDDDGDVDLLLVHHDGGVQLLRNDMQRGHWLQLRLRERLAGGGLGQGEGAAVVAWAGGVPLRRAATGSSYLSQSSRTLHFGLGAATAVERLEVRWPDGSVEQLAGLDGDARWELVQGEGAPRRLTPPRAPAAAAQGRQRVMEFWAAQRAGMDAVKRDGDLAVAVRHFRAALALDPTHEDSRYYLATCLWALGQRSAALAELETLTRGNALSLRGYRQWAVYRAMSAAGPEDLAAARAAAERALAINGEETGSLMLLGELALLAADETAAERHLAHACRTNPKAVGGYFLRGYLAWRRGDDAAARELLQSAREALGPEWKPRGAVAEGDVLQRQHRDETPLSRSWEQWNGSADELGRTFAPLAEHLASRAAA
jgi:tetratricopeptide (TPR) repeat protein